MVNTKSLPPALALLGEIEVTEGAVGQEQDTAVASAITSTHKTDELAAVATGLHRWQTGSGKQGAGTLMAIQHSRRSAFKTIGTKDDRRHHRNLTTGPPETTLYAQPVKPNLWGPDFATRSSPRR